MTSQSIYIYDTKNWKFYTLLTTLAKLMKCPIFYMAYENLYCNDKCVTFWKKNYKSKFDFYTNKMYKLKIN